MHYRKLFYIIIIIIIAFRDEKEKLKFDRYIR